MHKLHCRKPVSVFFHRAAAVFFCALCIESCSPDPQPAPPVEPSAGSASDTVPTLDIAAHMPETAISVPAPQKVVLSSFAHPNPKRIIRLTTNLRTTRNGQIAGEDLNDRIWNMLVAHTPDPYELHKVEKGKGDAAWGLLGVTFKRITERLRKVSKTAPQRSRASFGLTMALKLPDGYTSSWSGFDFQFVDEHYADEDLKVNAAFWKSLEDRLPTFTASDNAASWARSAGLITSRTSGGRHDAPDLPRHRYFDEGCILFYRDQHPYFQLLASPFSTPRALAIPSIISMKCSNDATFVASLNSQNDVNLYYQPPTAGHSWKTGIHFDTPINEENFAWHVDDDIICIWNGARASTARQTEIHCLNRQNGLPRWNVAPTNGMVRGFAATPDALTFILDQAIFSVSRRGDLNYVERLDPVNSRLPDPRSCSTENTIAFSMNPGQLSFLDLQSGDITWTLNTFNNEKLFCAPNGVVVFSEAGGYLLAVDSSTLQPLWKFRPVTMPYDMLTFGQNLLLLMNRAIIVLDIHTGRLLASFPINVPARRLIHFANRIFLDRPDGISNLEIK